MGTPRGWILCCALVFCVDAPHLLAQSTTDEATKCFSVHVRLNGKPIEGPRVITLKANQTTATSSLEAGCFSVPLAIVAEKAVDIAFTVPGNKISLWAIPSGFLAGPWDIDLADKKFGRDIALPRHARAREACAVVFHVGEPETAIVQTGCRTRLSGMAAKAKPAGG